MGYTGRMEKLWKWLPLGDKDSFSAEVKKLMFRDGTPVVVSENSEIFTMVMSTFQQYEKAVSRCMSVGNICSNFVSLSQGNPDGSHGNLLKWIVKCLKESDVFEKDFPFYIILVYRIKQ